MTAVAARSDLSQFRKADVTEVRYRGALGRYFHEVEEARIQDEVGDPQGPVLELGCGTGRTFRWLARPGNLLVGVDISMDMLNSARGNAAHDTVLLGGDFYALPFADGAFRTVVALGTFHMTDDIERPLAEIGRTMQSGGRLVFTCWNASPWAPKRLFKSRQASCFLPETIRTRLEEAGFSSVSIHSTFFLPPYIFWAGYKILRVEALRRIWAGFAIAINRFCMCKSGWSRRGGNLIVSATRR